MKIVMKNSNLVFQKYKLDRDVIIPGKLTQSYDEGTTVDITVNKGMYLITLPLISELSLQYYTRSYIYTIGKNSSLLYGPLSVSSYSLRYYIVNVEEDNTQISIFARADAGTNATFHIEEVKLPEISSWSTFYENTFNVTAGRGVYSFLQNEAHKFKAKHIYLAVLSDTTKVDCIQWFLGDPSGVYDYYRNDEVPYLPISSTDVVIDNKTQIGGANVVGTGPVTLTIYECDASDILQ